MILFAIILVVYVIWANVWYAKKESNPYIKYHKRKWKNESDYVEYIKWLDKKGGDIPLKEVKFSDDIEVLNEVNKQLNKP